MGSDEMDSRREHLLGAHLKETQNLKRMLSQVKLFHKLRQKKQNVTIEFCEKNLDRFLKEENFSSYDAFLKGKNINYKEYQCQSRCEECKLSPYAIVNGEFIAATDSEELLKNLKEIAESKN